MSVAGKGGRPLGLPKTGGRKKGIPNKATLVVAEKLAALGFDPIENLARIAIETSTPIELQVRINIELASYVHPKPKPVDNSCQADSPKVKICPTYEVSTQPGSST